MNPLSSSQKRKTTLIFQVLSVIATIAKSLKIEETIRKFALFMVRGYQLYISPHKGFCCAYKKLHNGQSCSAYFYSCISDRTLSLSTANNLFQQRLIDCKQAYFILRTDAHYQQQGKAKKRRKNNSECGHWSEWIDFSSFMYLCNCGDCGDCGDCDLGIDIGSCFF